MKDLFQTIYDKISDDLCILGYNAVLRFNVNLSRATQEGKRYHYHQEYEYNSNKYIDTNRLATIRRQFDYYLSIENLRAVDNNMRESIMIRVQDILYVREQLKEATRWVRGDKQYENLFVKKGNKMIILGNVPYIYISGLAGEKWLKLEPCVMTYNEVYYPGIRMFLSSQDNFVDMNIDKFMGLVYLIDTINMYESAQLLINYLQRPQFGTNIHTFDNKVPDIEEDIGYMETKIKDRKIGVDRKQKSFFDKIDEL